MNLEEFLERLNALLEAGYVPPTAEVVFLDHNLGKRLDIYQVSEDHGTIVLEA